MTPYNSRLALLLVLACLAFLLPSPVRAGSAECAPDLRATYDRNRITATFKLDLPSCWEGDGRYRVKAWVTRSEPAATREQQTAERKRCNPARSCRVTVRQPHPDLETASYDLTIEYMPNRNSVAISHTVLICSSAPAAAHCI